MFVWLLLGAFVCMGLSHGTYLKKEYGGTQGFRLHKRLDSIAFSPSYNSNVTVLWKRGDPVGTVGGKHVVTNTFFTMYNLTQRDNGRYIMRDKYEWEVSSYTLQVKAHTRTHERKPGEHLSFTFDLEPDCCNIYFFPENNAPRKFNIVHQGKFIDESDCKGFFMLRPCGIGNDALQVSCAGQYEIRDQNGDTAMEVSLEMESVPDEPDEPSSIAIGFGVFLSSLLCYCVKCCCCGKSSSKEDRSEPAAAEPDVQNQECDREPVGPRSVQPREHSGTHDLAQPSYSPPEYSVIYNHPALDLPPAYSEISAPAEQADAPTVPVNSDPEPQFELRGMDFPSAPLHTSDSAQCDVYNSDKLNFL